MRTSPTAARIVHLELPAVEGVLERATALIAGYDEELRRDLPAGAEIFDAHVHLGHDIDGFSGAYEDLERINNRYGISRCFMFCMDEPDRHPSFRAGNDRTLAFAERSGGRLIPFVRLDLAEDPIAEAARCLDLGARGLPPIADHLARLHEGYPNVSLIIAHAGIADLAALGRAFGGKAGIFFDTSVWRPVDLLDFHRL